MAAGVLLSSRRPVSFENGILMQGKPHRRGIVMPSGHLENPHGHRNCVPYCKRCGQQPLSLVWWWRLTTYTALSTSVLAECRDRRTDLFRAG
jgi:hypothetical protein